MSSHPFSFPPPPPAPPKASQSYAGVFQPVVGDNERRPGENRRSYGNWGHGRGFNRGGRRNEAYGSSRSDLTHGNPSTVTDKKYSSPQDGGNNFPSNNYQRSGYPQLSYPPIQFRHFPTNVHQGAGPQNPVIPANVRPPSHDYGLSFSTSEAPLSLAQNANSFQAKVHANQPVLMGPPIRMGFENLPQSDMSQRNEQRTVNEAGVYHHGLLERDESRFRRSSPKGLRSGRRESPTTSPGNRGRDHTRGRSKALSRPRTQNQRIQAAPAVPSFGTLLPLPSRPPALHGITRKGRKKEQRQNQLGLTPRAELTGQSKSSGEDDDTDEEARLAIVAGSAGQSHQLLQFDYKGRTSILKSAADIAAWIEERKKRFPTRARAAEVAEDRRHGERQELADRDAREVQEKHGPEVRKRKSQKAAKKEQRRKGEKPSEEAAAKSKLKVEKLRRQLEKEERRIAKAEAKASRDKTLYNAESAQDNENKKRKWTNRGGSGNEKFGDSKIIKPMLQEAVSIEPGPLTPTSQPTIADEGFDLPAKALDADSASNQTDLSIGQEGDGPSLLRTSPTMLDSHTIQSGQNSVSPSAGSETPTSSSGPSSDSEGESDDEAPAETSTKRHRLDRVGPPKRKQPKQTCRVFLRNGLCKRGSSCKYSHVLPERGSRTPGKQEVKRAEGRKERIGLYQRLVAREKEQEDHEAILHVQLGKKNLET